MSINKLTNPAVPSADFKADGVDTLLIEEFTGTVHKAYQEGENLLSHFDVKNVVGTNMVTNKFMGETSLQVLVPGQSPDPTPVEFNKNSLIVDTICMGRNSVHTLHDIQNDFSVMQDIAQNQMGKLKSHEDQMTLQQLMTGGLTGGVYDPFGATVITGGTQRVSGQGVAIQVKLNDDLTQAKDPLQLVCAIEMAIDGLVTQRTPLHNMRIVVPVAEFSILADAGIIATTQGGSNELSGTNVSGMKGILKSYNIPVTGSTEFTQMKINPNDGKGIDEHALLSNADNSYRYDTNAAMLTVHAIIYTSKALLAGRTIGVQGDIFFDKKTKGYFIDSWYAEGCIPDRYDNIAMVSSPSGAGDNAAVINKAKMRASVTRSYS